MNVPLISRAFENHSALLLSEKQNSEISFVRRILENLIHSCLRGQNYDRKDIWQALLKSLIGKLF